MKRTYGSRLLVTLLAGLLFVGCNLPSDAKLSAVFTGHSADFRNLIFISERDQGLKRLSPTLVTADNTIPEEKLQEYHSLFAKLGIKEGLERRDDYPNAIFFPVECQGTAITHDCKGYVYSAQALKPVEDSLDDPPAKIVFKKLSDEWYLFRDDG